MPLREGKAARHASRLPMHPTACVVERQADGAKRRHKQHQLARLHLALQRGANRRAGRPLSWGRHWVCTCSQVLPACAPAESRWPLSGLPRCLAWPVGSGRRRCCSGQPPSAQRAAAGTAGVCSSDRGAAGQGRTQPGSGMLGAPQQRAFAGDSAPSRRQWAVSTPIGLSKKHRAAPHNKRALYFGPHRGTPGPCVRTLCEAHTTAQRAEHTWILCSRSSQNCRTRPLAMARASLARLLQLRSPRPDGAPPTSGARSLRAYAHAHTYTQHTHTCMHTCRHL